MPGMAEMIANFLGDTNAVSAEYGGAAPAFSGIERARVHMAPEGPPTEDLARLQQVLGTANLDQDRLSALQRPFQGYLDPFNYGDPRFEGETNPFWQLLSKASTVGYEGAKGALQGIGAERGIPGTPLEMDASTSPASMQNMLLALLGNYAAGNSDLAGLLFGQGDAQAIRGKKNGNE